MANLQFAKLSSFGARSRIRFVFCRGLVFSMTPHLNSLTLWLWHNCQTLDWHLKHILAQYFRLESLSRHLSCDCSAFSREYCSLFANSDSIITCKHNNMCSDGPVEYWPAIGHFWLDPAAQYLKITRVQGGNSMRDHKIATRAFWQMLFFLQKYDLSLYF